MSGKSSVATDQKMMYPPQDFYSVMCPRGDKTSHLIIMGVDVAFYVGLGWVELYRLVVKKSEGIKP